MLQDEGLVADEDATGRVVAQLLRLRENRCQCGLRFKLASIGWCIMGHLSRLSWWFLAAQEPITQTYLG